MTELTFLRIDPDTGNLIYRGTDGNNYVELEGVIHDMTDEGEPLAPVKNVKIKDGEPVYDPNDRFARKLQAKLDAKKNEHYEMKNIKSFNELNEAKINEVAPMKFTKSTAGMIPANKKQEFKTDVKIKKTEWDAMLDKINKLPSSKRADIIKKLHQMGLM